VTLTQQNQLAGLCLALGGAYAAIWGASHVVPAVLLIVGLFVLNRRQSTNWLGRLGLILLVVDLAVGGILAMLTFLAPAALASTGVTTYLILGLLLAVGMIIYGIATVRAGRFRGGELLVVGPLLIIIIGAWGARLGAVGFVVLGYFLFMSKVAESDHSALANSR
jgi:hypothetical protein